MKDIKQINNVALLRLRLAKSVIKLINAQFIQSKANLFFVFVFSIVFIVLFGYLNMYGFSQNVGKLFMSFIVGIFTFEIIQTGIQTLPGAIVEFKTSVLLKRIGATPIRPIDFILITTFYYLVIIIIQFFWIILWLTLAFGFYEFQTEEGTTQNGIHFLFYGDVDWIGFFVSGVYIAILSIIVGIFVASISKNAIQSQVIGGVFFFSSMLLAGNLIPISSIDKIEALKYISLLTPFRPVNTLSYVAWNSPDPYAIFQPWNDVVLTFGKDITGQDNIYVIDSWIMWYSWFVPILYSALFIGLSIKFFKWSRR